ncbi:hypothetical protein WJX72_003881 [[Myrmecia] bisecta]|uniref:Uncharacterized protein n=1 Tax=[Myrmecia] bisecta TaxID=41462 RepID=A0AAW1P9N1_9CHLO
MAEAFLPQPETYRPAKLLASGGLAGAISRTFTAPIDRLKFLLQVQDGRTMMTLRQGLARMAEEGTMKAYFRGNGANVLKNIPETALKLTCNDVVKASVVSDGHAISLGERLVVGGVSGAIAQGAIYPLEVIQTRLAVSRVGTYKGILDAAHKIRHQEGYRAFFRGITPCMLGILPYAGLDIAAFELMKEHLHGQYADDAPPAYLLAAGMLSSTGAQLVSYPLGLVRTRLQAQGIGGEPLKYSGMLDVFRKTIRHEGVRGLYKGLMPNLMKIAPAAGISWVVFEKAKQHLKVADPRCSSQ